jgi:hypothetical protein
MGKLIRYSKLAALIAAFVVAFMGPPKAAAQTTVKEGNGSQLVIPWTVQGSSVPGSLPVPVNPAALTAGETTEVAVTNAAGGTTVPAVAFATRREVRLQNLGPNPIYCTVDGSAPVVLSNGDRILPGDRVPYAIGPLIILRCISATAAQVTTAATMVTELR